MKLIHLNTITLLFLLIGANFVFCHETNRENLSNTMVGEEPAKIIVIAMHVDPEHPEPGEEFMLGFTIKNNSTVMAEELNVTIILPAQLELLSGNKKVHLVNLGPNQERFLSWRIRANTSGDFIIELEFETSNLGTGQSRWLLEIFPRFTDIFLNPWFQLLAIIVLLAVAALVLVLFRKHVKVEKSIHKEPSNSSRLLLLK